ncbi:hypothetical protein SPONN_1022 [uncultured Candidatus Thioglobus sp.]|nr:hypothetical protein SPONN_1022 [uncultured Candidatus Thioglobus sp.]
MKVEFLEIATNELRQTYNYYENEQKFLGNQFSRSQAGTFFSTGKARREILRVSPVEFLYEPCP